MERFRTAVALDSRKFEAHGPGVAQHIFISRREITIDAVLDFNSRGFHGNRLAHLKHAIRLDGNLRIERVDAFRLRRQGGREETEGQYPANHRKRLSAAEEFHTFYVLNCRAGMLCRESQPDVTRRDRRVET